MLAPRQRGRKHRWPLLLMMFGDDAQPVRLQIADVLDKLD
jgi:hypothetical protein